MFETPVSKGDYIHIIGRFSTSDPCIIDDARNLIILNPDFLISSTVVADAITCVRKAVLQDRVKATGELSRPMVYGNILHALFQSALEANDFSTEYMHKIIDSLVIDNIENLYALREQVPVAIEHLRSKVSFFQSWAKLYVSVRPQVSC